MFGRGLLKEHFCETLVKISTVRYHPFLSQWKLQVAHSDESKRATSTRNATFVEANVMNFSTKFQLHPPDGF